MSTSYTTNVIGLGQSRARDVTVDGADAVVTRFQFASMAFFLHTPSTPQGTWRKICGKPVQGIWVYALPFTDMKPNPWKIALEIEGGKMLTLELYDTKSKRGTVFLVRPLTGDVDANPKDDFLKKFPKIRLTCAGRRVLGNITIRDIILKVQAANLLKYQLSDGRGHRHWVSLILSTIQDSVFEPPGRPHLKDEVDGLMRSRWVEENTRERRHVYENEAQDPANIVPGKWNPV
ncbi:hypothetical protein F5Y06DRAFT_296316 [Hypoxylon sp. FL0890]|nr:hypothetical protein F5Y06DRAFT_296316 [Hypoxylon sp. FL0890]